MFFKTFEFEFETRRLMWYCPYGGSDFAEVQSTYEFWYAEWYKRGNNLTTKNWIAMNFPLIIFIKDLNYYRFLMN